MTSFYYIPTYNDDPIQPKHYDAAKWLNGSKGLGLMISPSKGGLRQNGLNEYLKRGTIHISNRSKVDLSLWDKDRLLLAWPSKTTIEKFTYVFSIANVVLVLGWELFNSDYPANTNSVERLFLDTWTKQNNAMVIRHPSEIPTL